jgi:hypothetical protein
MEDSQVDWEKHVSFAASPFWMARAICHLRVEEIDRNDLTQWQGSQGLSERKAAGVDEAPVNEHTIRYASVDQVEPRSLIHG